MEREYHLLSERTGIRIDGFMDESISDSENKEKFRKMLDEAIEVVENNGTLPDHLMKCTFIPYKFRGGG